MESDNSKTKEKALNLSLYWQKCLTEDGTIYYFCNATQASCWDLPQRPAVILPEGWTVHISEDIDRLYFFNDLLTESSWDPPNGTLFLDEGEPEKVSIKDLKVRPFDIVNDLEVYWQTCDEGGRKYYFNEKTGVSVYELPKAVMENNTDKSLRVPVILPEGWFPAADPTDGTVYFANNSGETSWDPPPGTLRGVGPLAEVSNSDDEEKTSHVTFPEKWKVPAPRKSLHKKNLDFREKMPEQRASTRSTPLGMQLSRASMPRLPASSEFSSESFFDMHGDSGTPRAKRALELLRNAVLKLRARKAKTGTYRYLHRSILFWNKVNTTFLLVNASQARGFLQKIARDPEFVRIATLTYSEEIKYGFFEFKPNNIQESERSQMEDISITFWKQQYDKNLQVPTFFDLNNKTTNPVLPFNSIVVAKELTSQDSVVAPLWRIFRARVDKARRNILRSSVATSGTTMHPHPLRGAAQAVTPRTPMRQPLSAVSSGLRGSGGPFGPLSELGGSAVALSPRHSNSVRTPFTASKPRSSIHSSHLGNTPLKRKLKLPNGSPTAPSPPFTQLEKQPYASDGTSSVTSVPFAGKKGYFYKCDRNGGKFKLRYIVVDSVGKTLTWYKDSMVETWALSAGMGSPRGKISLFGARARPVKSESPSAPSDFGILISTKTRDITIFARNEAIRKEWLDFFDSEILSSPSAIQNARKSIRIPLHKLTGTKILYAESTVTDAYLAPKEDWLEVTNYTNDGLTRLWGCLDPKSRLFVFYSSSGREQGTEVAIIDLLSITIHLKVPHQAKGFPFGTHVFWISTHMNTGIYGLTKEGFTTPPTACVFPTRAVMDSWLKHFRATNDPSTIAASDELPSMFKEVPLSPTLLHSMKSKSLFRASPSVKKVQLVSEENALAVYNDAKGSKLLHKLHLHNAEIMFACDPQASNIKDYSRIYISITAESIGSEHKGRRTHIFRASSTDHIIRWVLAL